MVRVTRSAEETIHIGADSPAGSSALAFFCNTLHRGLFGFLAAGARDGGHVEVLGAGQETQKLGFDDPRIVAGLDGQDPVKAPIPSMVRSEVFREGIR